MQRVCTCLLVLISLLAAIGLALPSCQPAHGHTPAAEESPATAAAEIRPIPVKVRKAERRTFSQRTIATGVLEAARQADLEFQRGGYLASLHVQEGQTVKEGDVIAEIDDTELQLKLEQSRLELDQAMVEKKDLLIANGGHPESDSSVSAQKLELILTLSGYNQALHRIKQTKHELSHAQLTAPFDGIVAGVTTRALQQVNSGETICTLIDPESFSAVFSVLEEEALALSPGQAVTISPLAAPDRKYGARIQTINPRVNDQGLVKVRATLDHTSDDRLFEGMKLSVVLENRLPGQLVVPKSAIVLRSGREVVFTYDENTGKAEWNYVRSSRQNDAYAVIDEGLGKGDLVIYDGQLNLVHGTTVSIQEK